MLSPVPITQDQRSAGLLLHLRRFGLPPEPKSKIRRCLICKEVIHTGAESMGNKKAKYCTYCRRRTDHLNYLKFLIFLLVIITPGLTRAQGNLGSNSSPVVNRQGIPLGGVKIAICQPLATTAASVTNNLATLTMISNPITAGYVAGMQILVAGFTGGDTYFNAGTLTNGQIVGGWTILAVSSSTITFAITHSNGSASSNGTALQEGSTTIGCAALSSVYSDPALTVPATNPTMSDQLGNWNVFAASGIYDVQFYSPSTSPTMKLIWVSPGGGGMTWPSTPGITVCTGTPCTAWGTSLAAPSGAIVGTTDTQALTNKNLTGVGNTFPTFNQSTTGNAATATTATNLSGPGSVTGNYTHTGTETFANINKVVYADQQAGATADIKLANCFAALPSGGTCDARGFGATTQTVAATVTVPSLVTLLFDPSTHFQPGGAATNLFIFEPTSIIRGFTLDCTTQPSWSGVLFENDATKEYWSGTNLTEIGNISTNGVTCDAATGTPLILSSNSNSTQVQYVDIHDWRVFTGGTNGFLFTATSTGAVNGNHLSNIVWAGQTNGWHLTPAGGSINANSCSQCSFQAQSAGNIGWLIDGSSGQAISNRFIGSIWDDTVSIENVSTATQSSNTFLGYVNGTITDTSGKNFYYPSDANNDLGAFVGVFSLNSANPSGASAGDVNVPNGKCYRSATFGNGGSIQLICMDGTAGNYVALDPNGQGVKVGGIATVNPYPRVFTANGTGLVGPHVVTDTLTLSGGSGTITLSGSAIFTSAATFSCTGNDDTGLNPVHFSNSSGSSIAVTGTTTDVVRYICVGN